MSQLAIDLGVLSQREFRFSGVVRKTLQIFSRNVVPFSLIGLIAWLPSALVIDSTANMPPSQQALWSTAAGFLYLFLQFIAAAAILPAAFQEMRGRPVRLGDSIQRGLRRFFPLLGGGILILLGVMLGFTLLTLPFFFLSTRWYVSAPVAMVLGAILPIFILYTRWYVFAPVCVVEQKGPLGSMRRSAELTKGNRWKLFAISIINLAGARSLGELGELIDQFLTVLHLPTAAPIAALAVQGIINGVWFAFTNILGVVIYHDLRAAKEGVDIENIASVFD